MPRRPVNRSRAQLGTVRKLPSGRFQAFYIDNGRRITAPATFDSADGAEDWLQAERVDRRRGAWLDPTIGTETLVDYAQHWLAHRRVGSRELSPRTRDLYQRTLDRWILPPVPLPGGGTGVALGEYSLHAISSGIVRAWHADVVTGAQDAAVRRQDAPGRPIHPARVWARENGYTRRDGRPLGDSGRLSPAILAAWEAAGSPEPRQAGHAAALEHSRRDAGTTTAANAYRVLRAILTTAHEDGLIPSNPCKLRGAGNVHPHERAVASPAEVDAIADTFPDDLRAAVILAAWSGLRYGEQFALARKHVNLRAGTIRVERSLELVPGQPARFGLPKTDASARTLHLPAFVLDELRTHLRRHVDAFPDALLFTQGEAGSPVTSRKLSRLMAHARRDLDVPQGLTWHDLRHTSATLAYTAGASTRQVMDRLGHATTRAAQIYAHVAAGSDQQLAERLNAMRAPATVTPILAGAK